MENSAEPKRFGTKEDEEKYDTQTWKQDPEVSNRTPEGSGPASTLASALPTLHRRSLHALHIRR